MLETDECIKGERGGKTISYDNVGRYLDNTGFKTIIEGGWIGTNQNQSLLIEKIIKAILENGKTAVLAIKKKLEKDIISEQFEENEEGSDDFDKLPF